MFKRLILGIFLSIILINYSFAATEFSIVTESDNKDYIGGGKGRNFNNSNKDKISIVASDTKNVQFSVESFNIATSLNFSFGVEDGKALSKGLYDPAKRYPFRGGYNGIEISGDGRGCNNIVGKFYVHEYVVSSNGGLEKAAIDFVQYCEGGTSGLYGSIRYNSTVSSSCTKGGSCEGVKKNLGITTIKDSNTPKSDTVTNDTKLLKKLYKKNYKTFTAFMQGEYKMTYKKDFKNISKYCKTNKLFDTNKNSKNFFTNNICGTTYNDILEGFNEGFAEGMQDASDSDGELSKDAILDLRESIKEIQGMKKTTKLTTKEDMTLSIAILGLIRADYIIHNVIFSL